MRLLHIIPSLRWGSAERQLRMLLRELPAEFQQQLILLRGTATAELRRVIPTTSLGVGQRIDLPALRRLRHAITAATPDIVHCWRHEASLLATVVTRMLPIERVASVWQCSSVGRLAQLSRWWTKHMMSACIAPSWIESCAEYPSSGLMSIRYGVRASELDRNDQRARLTRALGIPAHAPIIGCVAPWLRESRLKDAVWAGDLLKVVRDDVHVVIAGYGPMRGRLETFRRQVQIEDRVHFASTDDLIGATLDAADIMWITGQTPNSAPLLLEAMSRGVPVIATNTPSHRRFVANDRHGIIVEVGHRAGFARHSIRLLESPEYARQLGAAAQDAALRLGETRHVIEQYAAVYRSLL